MAYLSGLWRGAQGKLHLEADVRIVHLGAQEVAQTRQAVADRLRVDVQLGGRRADVRPLAQPGQERRLEALARGRGLVPQGRQAVLPDLVAELRIEPGQERRAVLRGYDEAGPVLRLGQRERRDGAAVAAGGVVRADGRAHTRGRPL